MARRFSREEINSMSDDEFRKTINEKLSEIDKLHSENMKKLNSLSEKIIHGFITDNKIKNIIIHHGQDFLWALFAIIFTLGYFALFIAVNVEPPKWFMGVFIIGLFAIIWYSEYPAIWILEKMRTTWAEGNYKKCQLFKGEYVKTYIRYYKRTKSYFVKFTDENNKKRKCKIDYCEFEKYKESTPGYVWVIKYPKYKRGSFYIAYHPESFDNNSSIKEISKNSVI